TTRRWRFTARNFDVSNPAGGAEQVLTGTGLVYGVSDRSGSDGARSYNFAGGAATTLLGSNFTIPGDGSRYCSPWFTNTLEAGTEYIFGIAFTRPSSGAVKNSL